LQIEAGKLELQSSGFDLRTLVEDLGVLFAEPAHRKGLELVCDIPVTTPSALRGDSGRLRQILTNLVGNAIKFTDDGEILVRVVSIAESDDSATLRFEVSDTGPGIARDTQDTIFESFSQVDGTMTRQYGGSGLGLTISKQLVEFMDGDIGVNSTPGQGSRFWFTVSLRKEPINNADDSDGNAALQGVKVLIVDDNKTNREILQQQLDVWGAQHRCARRGAEALEILRSAAMRESPFEIVIDPDIDIHTLSCCILSIWKLKERVDSLGLTLQRS
jgi:anti-sigma regulatory factor (Ser/Thr protein kinase)